MIVSHEFLRNLALVLCVAGFTAVVFQRLRFPVVFGYLAAGMLVGPHLGLPFVASEEMVKELSELGVILLMYSLGLEFSFRRLIQIGATAGVAALAETMVMFGLGFTLAGLLGWTAKEQLFAGAIVAISSTTIIARTFSEQGVQGKLREIVFGVLIVEDLIAILLLALLSAIAAGSGVSVGALGITALELLTFLVALIVVGMVVLPRVMRMVIRADNNETVLIAGVGIAFAAALAALSFGYSVALGAFIAGSLVAEAGHAKRVEHLIEPIRDIFVAIFFVSVGMLIDPRMLAENWGAVLGVTVLVIVGKVVAVTIGVFLTGDGLHNAVRAGMSLAQIGEFSFIIAGVGLATGAIRPFLFAVAVGVSALTTLTTPPMVRRASRMAQLLDRKMPPALQTLTVLYTSWIDELRTSAQQPSGRKRLQHYVRFVLLDVAVLVGIMVLMGVELQRFTRWLSANTGLESDTCRYILLGTAVLASLPFIVGVKRMTRAIAVQLGERAMPTHERLDRAAAPRRAFVAMVQFGILLAIATPLVVLLQVFVPNLPAPIILIMLAIGLGLIVWRSAGNLYGHARAGAEVIVMALSQHDRLRTDADLTQTMEHMNTMLPGLGHPVAVRLTANSPAVGRTLGELDLRGVTGATVLAITRAAQDGVEAVVPSAGERLREGDVIALAGSTEAMSMAKQMLTGTEMLAAG